MEAKIILASWALFGAIVLLTASHGGCSEPHEEAQKKLPRMFDFDYYRQRFGKSYDSLSETLNRKRLFFSRAFKAFVSGVNYKMRLQSHYNALNDMSDWSEEERESTINKRMMEEAGRGQGEPDIEERDDDDDEDDEDDDDEFQDANEEFEKDFIPDEGERYEEELSKLISEHGDEPAFRELKRELGAGKRRARRDTQPREFSFDKLIASDEDSEPPSEKLVRRVKSNNPDYEPFELSTEGFANAEKVKWHNVKRRDSRPFIDQALEFLDSLFKRDWGREKEPEPKAGGASVASGATEMIVDLRRNGCIAPIRAQYRCGSCWAFATVAVMEYLYCNQTGTLVPFSPQYMLDCGVASHWLIGGCEGSPMPEPVAWFVNNFGMELATNYPYHAKDGECPYEKDIDVRKTGFIRTPIRNVATVHISRWAEVLPYGPILMGMAVGKDFLNYGGGVFNGKGCGLLENHAMVTIGYGREDGQDFWLIRNSHGRYWGVGGYMKLSKKYAKRCITSRIGQVLGTKDGVHYDIKFATNQNERPQKPWTERASKKG